MLRLGKLTDYAILIMSQMAKQTGITMSAATLAEQLHLGTPTVSKILKMLSDAHLVYSVRGAEGGYHLARAPLNISVADVVLAMESGLALTECCESTNLCALESMCTMRENWRKINTMIQSLLSRLTILDMLAPLPASGLSEELLHVE